MIFIWKINPKGVLCRVLAPFFQFLPSCNVTWINIFFQFMSPNGGDVVVTHKELRKQPPIERTSAITLRTPWGRFQVSTIISKQLKLRLK